MSRIESVFRTAMKLREGVLLGFVTAGDPYLKYTMPFCNALVDGGVDILELGVPFSDPIADGPTIQASTLRALQAGMTPRVTFDLVDELKRKIEAPIVLLTYYNPVLRMGVKRFVEYASKSEVDGLIIPDLPVEESSELKDASTSSAIDLIYLATPSTSISRLDRIVEEASGFLYLVSIHGVTGARDALQERTLKTVREFSLHISHRIPIAVGFGVSKPSHIQPLLASGADGVIVGSAFIKMIESNLENPDYICRDLKTYAHTLKDATKFRFQKENIRSAES